MLLFKGDYLQTTCLYRTTDKINATIGGHAITDEMCVNYMHYYPATDLEVCKSAVSNAALEKYFEFEKRFVNVNQPLFLFKHPYFLFKIQYLLQLG